MPGREDDSFEEVGKIRKARAGGVPERMGGKVVFIGRN